MEKITVPPFSFPSDCAQQFQPVYIFPLCLSLSGDLSATLMIEITFSRRWMKGFVYKKIMAFPFFKSQTLQLAR